ncbi:MULTISPECIES: hypothetical protein [Oceanobacillus]|uniref:DUF1836 domain-containing protein n=1 Tax=Oceanobacillus kimchii TaxID=746691 RepID=A0ABQ5TS55_9BACI|nr:hypothetical protein [Oceanobacillus kimchii]GLO68290.1 hypothetical protein MACH08_40740 [Oceanobacillus kimchii]
MDYKPLKNLILASLLSRGEVFKKKGDSTKQLIVPLIYENRYFLADYLKEFELQHYVKIDSESNEMTIYLTVEYIDLVDHWHDNSEKIFKKNFLKSTDIQAIILCLNLFGVRQVEGIAFSTTIKQAYLFTLSYTLKSLLNVNVIFSKNQLKITDVSKLLLEVIGKTSSKNSSYIAAYLNSKEKEKLIESTNIIQSKLGEDTYV